MNGRDLTGPGCFSASDMAHIAEDAGIYKTNKPLFQTYISAILAGAFISIAFVFYITATTGTADVPFGWSKFLGGACFSLGLMLVVACGVDLFTSTILTCVAKAGGRISGSQMAANWLRAYPSRCYWRSQFGHGQRAKTGAYT